MAANKRIQGLTTAAALATGDSTIIGQGTNAFKVALSALKDFIFTPAEVTKLAGIETAATADQTDAEVETAYNAQVGIVSQGDAEAGTATVAERWTPQRVGQAIGAASRKNVIINGNFDVWQRGTTFTAAIDVYNADRWIWNDIGTGVVDVKRSTSVPDATSDFSLQVDVTTADVTIAATASYLLNYRVEGYDAMQFGFGTSDAKKLTLSFRARSSKTGVHCVTFQNSAQDRSYVVEYTIAVADTWESFTITLTADTSGTWLTDSGIGILIGFSVAMGTDFHGTADTWNAADDRATSNQVNALDNAANNFHISRVQLELGSVATDFERRHIATELALCQRYYAKTFNQGTAPAQNAGTTGSVLYRAANAGASAAVATWQYPVSMRSGGQTIIFYNTSAANANWRNLQDVGDSAAGLNEQSSERRLLIGNAQVSTDGVGEQLAIHVTADAEL